MHSVGNVGKGLEGGGHNKNTAQYLTPLAVWSFQLSCLARLPRFQRTKGHFVCLLHKQELPLWGSKDKNSVVVKPKFCFLGALE